MVDRHGHQTFANPEQPAEADDDVANLVLSDLSAIVAGELNDQVLDSAGFDAVTIDDACSLQRPRPVGASLPVDERLERRDRISHDDITGVVDLWRRYQQVDRGVGDLSRCPGRADVD